MQLKVAAIGQRAPAWVESAWREYQRRMPPVLPLELRELPLAHRGRHPDIERARRQEGESLLAAVPNGALVVALDTAGRAWSTAELAERLAAWMQDGRDVCFLIGGPDGYAADCLERADLRWSLGPLTLPHALVRVILAEQLYRAWAILNNHPYHRA